MHVYDTVRLYSEIQALIQQKGFLWEENNNKVSIIRDEGDKEFIEAYFIIYPEIEIVEVIVEHYEKQVLINVVSKSEMKIIKEKVLLR